MSLEKQLELNTAAVNDLAHMIAGLTAAIGAMQAPVPLEVKHKVTAKDVAENRAEGESLMGTKARLEKEGVPNDQPPSTDTTSGEQSQPTGELSSPELTYNDHVKTATLKLSQKMGREVAIAVLGRFGVKGAQNLDASQWADYIAHCESVMNEGGV